MPQPNIILLYSDQHRRDALGCFGGSWVHSPNLDLDFWAKGGGEQGSASGLST